MTSMTEGARPPSAPLKVFSYSHKDADSMKQLRVNLDRMRDEGLIVDWHDGMIVPGADFNEEIRAKLDESDLILLLVDADFLASEYIKEHELPRALEREQQGQLRVIPVLLSYFENWRNHPLFASRQGVPSGDTGVLQRKDRRKAWALVAEGIRRAAEDWKERKEDGGQARDAQAVTDAEGAGPSKEGRIEFVYKPPFDATLFQRIGKNPYTIFRPNEAGEPSRVRAFLWLPPRETLLGRKLRPFTTMAVVCDAGRPELEGQASEIDADLKEVQAYYRNGRNPLSAMPQVSCTVGLAPSPHGARGTPPTGR
ncbi:MAG TPA: toll/interleukin-1 receptor domain-containing protein [Isosphaeraceae bacterium]|jgi:hypothetical protein|nr:toll/interleukin-1 receptor domain-containing protein [Isosphaeraceae bacterium]